LNNSSDDENSLKSADKDEEGSENEIDESISASSSENI
jgi:hypothetical protein